MKLWLVAAFLLCLFIPIAMSLECLAGCKASGGPGAEMACNGVKTGRITCEPYLDRCMTMKLSMSIFPGSSTEMEMRNCSSSFVCDPSSDFHMCSLVNSTGVFSECSMRCCHGDMCNGPKPAHVADFVRRLFGRFN
ncbi:uncharacterized protein LOC144636544 isoform X1 [Oculina patagonica]